MVLSYGTSQMTKQTLRQLFPSLVIALLASHPAAAAEVSCGTSGDAAGWSVATGMDFDGDTVADIAVAAPCARVNGLPNVGTVTVYSGADGSKLLLVKGQHASQKLGAAIAFVRDMNGDGLAELAVGSIGYDVPKPPPSTGTKNGAGMVEVFSSDGSVLLHVEGVYAGGGMGEALAGLSDVTGDGIPDLLVGAGNDRFEPGGDKVGIAYLVSGADGSVVDESRGEYRFDEWGRVVASGADFNRDGVEDVVVASNLADVLTKVGGTPEQDNGVVRVLSGADMSRVLAVFRGAKPEDKLGRSVAVVPDMNGDNTPDLFVGAPGTDSRNGSVVLSKTGTVLLFSATGQQLLEIKEPKPEPGAGFGTAVAEVGLVDGDGRTDVVASAPGALVGRAAGAGRVHMISGTDGDILWTLAGELPGAKLGQSLAGGPDWDDDGVPDAVIGAPGDAPRGRRGAGTVRVVSGADGSEIRRFEGRRGVETRIFTLGWRPGGRAVLRGLGSTGRRRGVRKDVFRRLRSGDLSVAVLDDGKAQDPTAMVLAVGAGHGADDSTVTVLQADHTGRVVSDFRAGFTNPYPGGVNVGGGVLDDQVDDDIAAVQADSEDGTVEVSLYHRFDTDPLSGRLSWSVFHRFFAFEAATVIDGFAIGADGATIAIGDLEQPLGELPEDRRDEIVVGTAGGVPAVRVFHKPPAPAPEDPPLEEPLPPFELFAEWLAYPPGLNSGTSIAVGDLDGNGTDEIVTGPYSGQARIKAFNGDGTPFLNPATLLPVDFFVSPSITKGVRVGVADVDLDGIGEILVAPVESAELLAYEVDGTAVSGWPNPRPYGPVRGKSMAMASTDRFLRHR